jgi:1-acyl-sn-glycerol-3-phosphate acyltransferase
MFCSGLEYLRRFVLWRHSFAVTKAAWLQNCARRVLRIFRFEVHVTGRIPSTGLLVCNHLSYLDILLLAALTPCIFVAKSEVKYWPFFGWFACLAGTIFVCREKRTQATKAASQIEAALGKGVLVVLFAEGTSSGGETVLPFKSSLLEPAVRREHSVTAGFLAYELADGNVSEELCYWKDMTLVPHLINLLSKRSIRGSVSFAQLQPGFGNRKELAQQLRAEVLRLRKHWQLNA